MFLCILVRIGSWLMRPTKKLDVIFVKPMDRLWIGNCPICGENGFETSVTCKDYCVSSKRFDLLTCKNCGFTFTQGVPVESQMDKYYQSPGYISHTNTSRGITNKLYHCIRAIMLRRKAGMVSKESHLKSGKLLDIGAGTGFFANTMIKKGWNVEATEKSARARAFAQTRFGFTVKPEQAINDYSNNQFDVITMWHVMEHIQPLNQMWDTLYQLLQEKGLLIVACPNLLSFDARRYGEYWAAYDVPRHLWHFCPDTIRRIGAEHGFIMAKHYPMPFDAFYISILSEKYRHKVFPFARGMFWGSIAWLNTLAKKDSSSSIVYIFRKKH